MGGEPSVEYRALTYGQLTRQWDDLVDKVRLLPSFKTFLKPLECSELVQSLPRQGPIVVINVHNTRCDAIALVDRLGEPLHISLPDFSWEKAKKYSGELRKELQDRGLGRRGDSEVSQDEEAERKLGSFGKKGVSKEKREESRIVRRILRCLWTELVKPILDGLNITVSTSLRAVGD
jgi:hypothetical protein